MLSTYCLGCQHWTVIPHQMEEAFKDMVDTGFDAVCLSFCEGEMRYSRRAFEIQVELAHKAGLKALVIPDHISVYYYAHNNEDPEAVQGIVRRLMKKYC